MPGQLVRSPSFIIVFCHVTGLAQAFQIVPVQCYIRIINVLRCQPDLVVDFLTWNNQTDLPAPLTQSIDRPFVCPCTFDPRPRNIEVMSELLCHSNHHKQNPAFYISWVPVCLSHTAISLSCVVASDRTCTDAIVTANCTQMHRTVRANHRPKDGRERRAALHRPSDIDRERDEPGVEVYPQNLTLSLYADRV